MFFVAEKLSPIMRNYTVLDFNNLHSLLGLFVVWFLNRGNQVTGVGLWSKKELFQRDPKGILKISCRRKSQLFVLYQVDTDDPCCGLSVIFCGFTHMTRCKTINIPENFSGVHGFTGKTNRSKNFSCIQMFFTAFV